MFTFSVPGEPAGKQRPRFMRSGHVYTPKKTHDYEMLVAQTYKAQHGKWYGTQPIRLKVVAYFEPPKSMSKKRKVQILSFHPTKRPDMDNIVKIVMDGLNGIAYKDDCQVWKVEAEKLYGLDGHVVVSLEADEPEVFK